jgi:hypothetical protein
MKIIHKILLLVDCFVNVSIGLLLLLFPFGIVDLLGLPQTSTNFYASILGAVLFGIGLALLLELTGRGRRFRGLGLGGAILINLSGSLVLIFWLLFGALDMPLKGSIILWVIGLTVFIIGAVEFLTKSWSYKK